MVSYSGLLGDEEGGLVFNFALPPVLFGVSGTIYLRAFLGLYLPSLPGLGLSVSFHPTEV